MPLSRRPVRTAVAIVAILGPSFLSIGCGSEEGIHSYRVAKPAASTGKATTAGAYRILGAAYPADDPVWYFKYTGTAEQIAKYEAEFDKLAASVRLQADPKAMPTFDLPTGWTRTGPRAVSRGGIQLRIDETLKFGTSDAPQEITITYVPGGGVRENVGRWLTQVQGNAAKTSVDDLAKYTRAFDASGVKGLRVDVSGPKNPAAGGGPMMGRGR